MADATGFEDLVQSPPVVSNKQEPTGFEDLVPKKEVIVNQPHQTSPDFLDQLGRGAGLTVRALAQGAASLPNMALDMVQTLGALPSHPEAFLHPFKPITGETQTQKFEKALDTLGLPRPQGAAEKTGSFISSLFGGAAVPIPLPTNRVPANFVSPGTAQAQRLAGVLRQSRQSGLVVPPSTTNPTIVNRTLETIAGKDNTQMAARAVNQTARNALAARDLGLHPEVFTPEAVEAVRQQAGEAFGAAREIPNIRTDGQYITDLANVLRESHGSNASFPGSANPDVENIVNTYLQPNFTGDAAVSALSLLRSHASDAFRQGRSELGRAYRGVAQAIEDQLERGASQQLGPQYGGLVQALRQARRTYAQASTIEEAMDPLGNVSGQRLAQMWRRGEPLQGGTLQAAEHAAMFPKANLPANSSNISHLNMYGIMGLAGGVGEHFGGLKGLLAGAALPASRAAARSYLLSRFGQAAGIPSTEPSTSAELARALLRRPGIVSAASESDNQ